MSHKKTLLHAALFLAAFLAASGHAQAESLREAALARGYDLPRPFGIGVSYLTQDQDFSIDHLTLGIDSIDPAVAAGLDIENETDTIHLTADYWILPFLDLYAILGNVDGTTHVGLSQINIGLPLQDLDIDYDGLLYGAGAVLAYGGDHVFVLVDVSYSWTNLSGSASSVEALVATPRIGYDFGKVSVWGGAMYQEPDERHRGVVVIPGLGPVPYDVTLGSKDHWNYTAGLNVKLNEHWFASLEGGFGPRSMVLAHFEYRFGSNDR
ncbi:MAG TPA: hypothetical protein VLA20_09045 [Vicinamibacterales bacterium]|nr:hypothetical protein [Vicinamibacterales bacterium]